jgi:type IV secretory pathway protease TraF
MALGLLNPGIPKDLKAGEYVLMVWQGSDPNGVATLREGTALVKKVGCLPGQHLKVTMRQADCDGVKVGHIRHNTIDGKPISPALYDGVIPPGKVFLLGEHYYSYDSRYFGLVDYSRLIGLVTAIL